MLIKTERLFEVEVQYGEFFLRLPFIGQCHYSPLGFYWDSWRTLRGTGEV